MTTPSNPEEREAIVQGLAKHFRLEEDGDSFGVVDTSRKNPDYGSDEPVFMPVYHRDQLEEIAGYVIEKRLQTELWILGRLKAEADTPFTNVKQTIYVLHDEAWRKLKEYQLHSSRKESENND